MKIPKTCILCKHFDFNSGEEDYSDLTPGEAWSASCLRGHFVMVGRKVTSDEYCLNLLKAETCPDLRVNVELLNKPNKKEV